jgi:DNA modification methylase
MIDRGPASLILRADVRRSIPLADRSVHCVVTSPPFFGLRDYGDPRQIGLEATPEAYVTRLVEVCREVRRVLRDDGTFWLNLGDSYSGGGGFSPDAPSNQPEASAARRAPHNQAGRRNDGGGSRLYKGRAPAHGCKPKDLIGIPWRVAFALRDDGWFLRDPIVWSKAEVDDDGVIDGGVMPGSYQDRCTSAYEMVFMLARCGRYYFDRHAELSPTGAPLRNVWRINTEPSSAGHFAQMPTALAARCVRLGTSERGCCPACLAPHVRVVEKHREATRPGLTSKVHGVDPAAMNGRPAGSNVVGYRDPRRYVTATRTLGWQPSCACDAGPPVQCRVLDPFGGSMTTLAVATALGRVGIATELNADYVALGRRRLSRPHAPAPRASARNGHAPAPLFDRLEDTPC